MEKKEEKKEEDNKLKVVHIHDKHVITWVTQTTFDTFKATHTEFIEFKIKPKTYQIYYEMPKKEGIPIEYANWFENEVMIINVTGESVEPQFIPEILKHLKYLNEDLKCS